MLGLQKCSQSLAKLLPNSKTLNFLFQSKKVRLGVKYLESTFVTIFVEMLSHFALLTVLKIDGWKKDSIIIFAGFKITKKLPSHFF